MKLILRSILFNIAFYGSTGLLAFLLCWTCFLPRRYALKTAHLWNWITYQVERHILGLTYEIKGIENLPKSGCFIVAAKHQSAWETIKLHRLFNDPAIVLKKELLSIPFLGWFFKKLDMIAIDRGRGVNALKLMEKTANTVKEQGRPIIIFPQGTRVSVRRRMSYKYGAIRLYDMLQVPIIPTALNSGAFWPKKSFFKTGGIITIEFMPPIPPGVPGTEALVTMQHLIEERSDYWSEQAIATLSEREKKYLKIPAPLSEGSDDAD